MIRLRVHGVVLWWGERPLETHSSGSDLSTLPRLHKCLLVTQGKSSNLIFWKEKILDPDLCRSKCLDPDSHRSRSRTPKLQNPQKTFCYPNLCVFNLRWTMGILQRDSVKPRMRTPPFQMTSIFKTHPAPKKC